MTSHDGDLSRMEGERCLKVDLRTFIFSKEGGNSFRISERSKRMVKFMCLGGTAASWVAKG